MEVTKCLKPSDSGSRNTVTARAAGRNASERRASLEKDDMQAARSTFREKLTRMGGSAMSTPSRCTGSGGSMASSRC